jgi:hypothetical protein
LKYAPLYLLTVVAKIIKISSPTSSNGQTEDFDVEKDIITVKKDEFKEGDLALYISDVSALSEDMREQVNAEAGSVLLPITHPIFVKILGFRYEGEDLSEQLGLKEENDRERTV